MSDEEREQIKKLLDEMNEVISVDIPNVAKFQWINLDYYCIEKICMEIVSRENVCLIMDACIIEAHASCKITYFFSKQNYQLSIKIKFLFML